MRTLVLLRHAKSDYPPGVPDHDRPLAPRGRRDAPAAGEWIGQHCPPFDRVVVSSANRAQETWRLASAQIQVSGETITDPRVYEASAATLASLVAALPDEAKTVLLVGHNPGLEDLSGMVISAGDVTARERLASKFPTSAIAVLRAGGGWAELVAGADLVDFVIPRG